MSGHLREGYLGMVLAVDDHLLAGHLGYRPLSYQGVDSRSLRYRDCRILFF